MIEPGAFTEQARKPTGPALAAVLGDTHDLWKQARTVIAAQHAPVSEEWVFGGKNYGWSLRLKQKKRAVVYLTPCEGYFRAGFAFGEKAARAARDAKLPTPALALIDTAPKYAEGRAVRMDVRRASDVRLLAALAAIKMAN